MALAAATTREGNCTEIVQPNRADTTSVFLITCKTFISNDGPLKDLEG